MQKNRLPNKQSEEIEWARGMKMNKMIVTDLDGTLLDNSNRLSAQNRLTLERLGGMGIVRTVATGRSFFSAKRVLADDFPIDYIIVSTGSGIYDWKKKQLIGKNLISSQAAAAVTELFLDCKIGFMLHEPIPDNHRFYYYKGQDVTDDYDLRVSLYEGYALPFKFYNKTKKEATQFVSMFPGEKQFLEAKTIIQGCSSQISCIKTTSPLNGRSLWLEVFAAQVCKSKAAEKLAADLGIKHEDIAVIGNDWNDYDLLEWSRNSFLVANAPEKLHEKYRVVADNERNGFSQAVEEWLE